MKKYIPTVLFTLFIIGFAILDIFTPNQEFSDTENRYLTQFTPPTVDTVMNNSFPIEYESYINDQFVGRDKWITLKSLGESALLKKENNGIVYGNDHYMFDKNETVDTDRLTRNLNYIQEFGTTYKDQNVYFTVIPSSYAILEDKLPYGLPIEDQQAIVTDIYKSYCGVNVVSIDLFDKLTQHKDEYIYYKTDHHWTADGAYLAYQSFIEAVGGEVKDPSQYTAHTVEDFYGTYFSKAKQFSAQPDTITYYDIPCDSIQINGEEKDSLYDYDMFTKRDKYAGYIHSNNGVTILENSQAEQGSLLLIKDSYGNCLAPYFLQNYSRVIVVDLRYTDQLQQLIETENFDEIYILYSLANFSTDSSVIKLLPLD